MQDQGSSRPTLFSELKRRRIFRVAAVYAVVAWAIVEVATAVFPPLDMPEWSLRLVILLVLFGFLVALVLAWSFELTPEGPRRESEEAVAGELERDPEPGQAETARQPAALQRAALTGLALVVVGVLAGSVYLLRQPLDGPSAATARDATAGMSVLTQLTFSAGVEEYPAFAPGGDRLALSRSVGDFKQIYVRSLATNQEVQLTSEPFDHIQPTWSADGDALLFVQGKGATEKLAPADVYDRFVNGDVWRLEIGTGQRRPFLEDAYHAAYSPDGSRVAFEASWAGARRIWIADSLGHNPRQLTTDHSEEVKHIAPAWSPDGRRIAFQNIEKTKLDIRVVDVATGAMTWVTDDLYKDVDPIWSRDGREIFFSSARGGGINLWRIAVTSEGEPGGPPRQITTGAGQDLNPTIAPDGTRLAFAILSQNADLWRLPVAPETGAAAGPPEPLIATSREESRGVLSPDGRRLAFNSDRRGEMNLWLHSLADDATQQLTSGPGGDYQPRWSPDGRTLVFFSSRSGNADIWTVDVETGQLDQLTTDPALDVNPFFSPDGRMIAFQSDRGGRKEVWLMNADGSDLRRLTTGGAGDHFLLWTGDSRSLLVNTPGPGVGRLFVDGSPARDLSGIRGGAHMSSSPDESLIMDVVGHRTLWVSPFDGGDPRLVFEFEDSEVRIDYPTWSPDGRWVVFDRFAPTAGDIWVLDLEGIAAPAS